MQSFDSATRHAETLMAQALPTDFVGVLVSSSLIPEALGANNGIHLWMDDCFDGTNCSDRFRQRVVAHEIGHYWWGQGVGIHHEDWISEGAAEYIGAYSMKTQFSDSRLSTDNWPCPYYRTIEHLRADNPDYRFSQGSLCNYSLGERLFINLDRNMGHTAFATGFRNLHQRLSTYADDEIDQGISLMSAFCSQCLDPDAGFSGADYTLARWYGEKVLTDSSTATGTIAGLGSSPIVSLRDYGHHSRQFGIAEVSASSPDQRRWLQLYFSDATQTRRKPSGSQCNSTTKSSTLITLPGRSERCTRVNPVRRHGSTFIWATRFGAPPATTGCTCTTRMGRRLPRPSTRWCRKPFKRYP